MPYVPGNHEFYGGSISGVADELRRHCAGTPVQVLDSDEIVIGGVRFLGTAHSSLERSSAKITGKCSRHLRYFFAPASDTAQSRPSPSNAMPSMPMMVS